MRFRGWTGVALSEFYVVACSERASLIHGAACVLERRRCPCGLALRQLFWRDKQVECPLIGIGIDADHVAVLDEGNRSTDLCLWGNVPDDQAV